MTPEEILKMADAEGVAVNPRMGYLTHRGGSPKLQALLKENEPEILAYLGHRWMGAVHALTPQRSPRYIRYIRRLRRIRGR